MSSRATLWILMAIAVAALSIGAALAQEKPARAMRQWQLGALDSEPWYANRARVDVFDTEGVCLYVARGTTDGSLGIIAVPKTQLPKGAGCQ